MTDSLFRFHLRPILILLLESCHFLNSCRLRVYFLITAVLWNPPEAHPKPSRPLAPAPRPDFSHWRPTVCLRFEQMTLFFDTILCYLIISCLWLQTISKFIWCALKLSLTTRWHRWHRWHWGLAGRTASFRYGIHTVSAFCYPSSNNKQFMPIIPFDRFFWLNNHLLVSIN